jgi:hypothetical protein
MNLPIISLQIQGMKETILHAFSERMIDLSSEVKLSLDRYCTPENIQRSIDETVRPLVDEAINTAVRKWWLLSEEGQKLLNEAVALRLEEEAKWLKK